MDAVVRLRGDASLGFKVGLAMLLVAIPAYWLFTLLGDRSFVGMMVMSFGGVLGALSPIPLFVSYRLMQQRVELANGRLRVTNHRRSVEFGLDEIDGVLAVEGERGWLYLSFNRKGETVRVDPRGFDRAGVATLLAAIRAARPDLAV